jgi:N-dimethylarginine dimethylaminohydrolase
MLRILIEPTTYTIIPEQDDQNPYIDIHYRNNKKKILEQHRHLEKTLYNTIRYTIRKPVHVLPDIVFTANAGLCFPRIPKTILLPRMKYKQRQEELSYLVQIFKELKLTLLTLPGKEPFEGQAEIKWFCGGLKAVGGYGHRSTKKSFDDFNTLCKHIYGSYGLAPPKIMALPIASSHYYHLDLAMLEFDDTKCIVHKHAFSDTSIKRLKKFLGAQNVFVIDTTDSFCLNAIVDGDNLITHTLSPSLKKELEHITHRTIKMINTSEFELSGGSVRCMTLDIY